MERKGSFLLKVCLVLVCHAILGVGIASADFNFQHIVNMGPEINSSASDGPGCISYDGLEFYLVSQRGGDLDLWVSKRESVHQDWSTPFHLGPTINFEWINESACISSDGRELYYVTFSAPFQGGDLWVSRRADKNAPWGPPESVSPLINGSSFVNQSPWITADGLELYYSSTRPGGLGRDDIYVSRRETVTAPWGAPENLGAPVNSEYSASFVSVSADRRALFFCENPNWPKIPGGFGNSDIYISTRKNVEGPWGEPVNLGPKINTNNHDIEPRISPDGFTLYFTSKRSGFLGGFWGDAYEVAIVPSVDFNSDGLVGIQDLTRLIEHWGTSASTFDIGPMAWGDGVVDKADLEALMNHWGQEVNDPTLAANWKLDETDGATALESVSGVPSLVVGNPAWHPESGKLGGALQFDGVDDFILSQFPINPPDGPFSVLAWVKGGAPGQVVVAQLGGENWLMADENGFLRSELEAVGRGDPSLSSEVQITDGNWHRIGLVWDGSSRNLYVDDALVATSLEDEVLRSSDGSLAIGAGSGPDPGTYWSGLIDEVRIYDRALAP